MFPDKLHVSSFPGRFSHYASTAAWSIKVVYACRWQVHLHFWENDRGILRATAVTRGWNGHRIRVSSQSSFWRRKFSRRSCRDSNSQPFDHESGAFINQLSRLSNTDTGSGKPMRFHHASICLLNAANAGLAHNVPSADTYVCLQQAAVRKCTALIRRTLYINTPNRIYDTLSSMSLGLAAHTLFIPHSIIPRKPQDPSEIIKTPLR